MGYTTTFGGSFQLDRPLSDAQRAYLKSFSETRRVKRDVVTTSTKPDPIREAAGLPLGVEAGYYVGDTTTWGWEASDGVLNDNAPPTGQPGLWCNWCPSDGGMEIVWNEAEKFYNYVEWIVYLIKHFLEPWGYLVNGEVRYQGEDYDDRGVIAVRNNVVRSADDIIEQEEWEYMTEYYTPDSRKPRATA